MTIGENKLLYDLFTEMSDVYSRRCCEDIPLSDYIPDCIDRVNLFRKYSTFYEEEDYKNNDFNIVSGSQLVDIFQNMLCKQD